MTGTPGPERMEHPRRCTATRKNGLPCTRWAILGGNVCMVHGGKAPQVRRAALERHQRATAMEKLRSGKLALTSSDPAVEAIDPRDALALELARTSMAVDVLGGLVNDLSLDEQGRPLDAKGTLYGDLYHHTGERTGEAKPHVLWVMWHAERQHLTRVAKEAASAGVEARRIALAEQTAQMVAQLFRAVFSDPELGLLPAVQQQGLQVAARHMRALPG